MQRPGFRRCRDAAFALEQRPKGKATLSFWIGLDGHVSVATVTTTGFDNCQIATCLRDELAESVFPEPQGGPAYFSDSFSVESPDRDARSPSTTVRPQTTVAHDDPSQCIDHQTPPTQRKSFVGRLRPEIVQSTVRANHPRFGRCFEPGLARDPKLAGDIAIRFVIGTDGSVTSSAVETNTLPDCEVTRCIRDAYRSIRFPAPEGGPVEVVYPLMLGPG